MSKETLGRRRACASVGVALGKNVCEYCARVCVYAHTHIAYTAYTTLSHIASRRGASHYATRLLRGGCARDGVGIIEERVLQSWPPEA